MARVAMVTRTIKAWEVVVNAVDLKEGGKLVNVSVTVDGRLAREKVETEAMKQATSDTLKPYMVEKAEIKEQLYGMTEEQFMLFATPMNDRFEKITD